VSHMCTYSTHRETSGEAIHDQAAEYGEVRKGRRWTSGGRSRPMYGRVVPPVVSLTTSLVTILVFSAHPTSPDPGPCLNMLCNLRGGCFCIMLQKMLSLPGPEWQACRQASQQPALHLHLGIKGAGYSKVNAVCNRGMTGFGQAY
jgi:hypothetical protein